MILLLLQLKFEHLHRLHVGVLLDGDAGRPGADDGYVVELAVERAGKTRENDQKLRRRGRGMMRGRRRGGVGEVGRVTIAQTKSRVMEGTAVKRMGGVFKPTTTMRRLANLCEVRDFIIHN